MRSVSWWFIFRFRISIFVISLDKNFVISDNEINFSFTDQYPISEQEIQSISIDKVDSFFQDKRLSHIPNFKFLIDVFYFIHNLEISDRDYATKFG